MSLEWLVRVHIENEEWIVEHESAQNRMLRSTQRRKPQFLRSVWKATNHREMYIDGRTHIHIYIWSKQMVYDLRFANAGSNRILIIFMALLALTFFTHVTSENNESILWDFLAFPEVWEWLFCLLWRVITLQGVDYLLRNGRARPCWPFTVTFRHFRMEITGKLLSIFDSMQRQKSPRIYYNKKKKYKVKLWSGNVVEIWA